MTGVAQIDDIEDAPRLNDRDRQQRRTAPDPNESFERMYLTVGYGVFCRPLAHNSSQKVSSRFVVILFPSPAKLLLE